MHFCSESTFPLTYFIASIGGRVFVGVENVEAPGMHSRSILQALLRIPLNAFHQRSHEHSVRAYIRRLKFARPIES